MEQVNDDIFNQILTFLENTSPVYIGAAVFLILILILIPILLRSNKRSKAKKVAPNILLQSFQISPLGRDGWLRLRNEGELAVLKDFQIKGRKDIGVKTNFREIKIQKGNTYSLFLQAIATERIREDFEVVFMYTDTIGNNYRQVLKVGDKTMMKTKLL